MYVPRSPLIASDQWVSHYVCMCVFQRVHSAWTLNLSVCVQCIDKFEATIWLSVCSWMWILVMMLSNRLLNGYLPCCPSNGTWMNVCLCVCVRAPANKWHTLCGFYDGRHLTLARCDCSQYTHRLSLTLTHCEPQCCRGVIQFRTKHFINICQHFTSYHEARHRPHTHRIIHEHAAPSLHCTSFEYLPSMAPLQACIHTHILIPMLKWCTLTTEQLSTRSCIDTWWPHKSNTHAHHTPIEPIWWKGN